MFEVVKIGTYEKSIANFHEKELAEYHFKRACRKENEWLVVILLDVNNDELLEVHN